MYFRQYFSPNYLIMKNIFILIALLTTPFLLQAWGPNGHRVVAQICYNNLSPEARKMVDESLGDHYLTQVANWPDFIKAEKNWAFTKPWHYMTVSPGKTLAQTIKDAASDPKIDNVMEGIELMLAILKNDTTAIHIFQDLMDENKVKPLAGSIQATAFAFLIHFIGDIHQPMHVGKNKDLGGNKIRVLYFSKESNLHAVWDGGLIEHEQLSYTEFTSFVEKHTAKLKASCENDTMVKWVEESIDLREKLYNTLYDNTDRTTGLPDFSWSYQHDFIPVVENRLGAAGYRAAALINGVFK